MAFHVGQKVVCVDDTELTFPFNCIYGETKPVRWHTYTIRGFDSAMPNLGVYLNEIVNSPGAYADPVSPLRIVVVEQCFDAARFSPLQEKSTETGMGILRRVAQDATEKRYVTVKVGD